MGWGWGCLALSVFPEHCFHAAHPGSYFVFLQDIQSLGRGSWRGVWTCCSSRSGRWQFLWVSRGKSEGRGVNRIFFMVLMLVFLDIPEKEKELLSDCRLL